MRFDINDYDLGCRIFSIAFCENVLDLLLEKNLKAALMTDDGLIFYPEKRIFTLTKENREKLAICENYDVLFINDEGNGYVHFSNENDDNPLILTQKCNSNCLMCPTAEVIRRKENGLNIDYTIESIRYIPNDARHLTITGGEPFLVKEKIFDLLSEIKTRLPYTECLLLTNGRALGYKPYADKFAELSPKKIIIGIPLHGYNSETHDRITQSKGGFMQTVSGIKNLIYRGFNVEIRLVVSKLNYKYIDKIAELIVNEFPKVGSVKIMGLEMSGNAARNVDDVWIPYPTAFEHSKSAITKLVSNGINVGLYNFPLCAVGRSFHLLCAKSITGYKIRFAEKCEECKKRENCGGIFAGTIRLAGKDVIPWREND